MLPAIKVVPSFFGMKIFPESGDETDNSISNNVPTHTKNSDKSAAVAKFVEQNKIPSSNGDSSEVGEREYNAMAAQAEKLKKSKYVPGMFDVWAMVITTVLVGLYYGWNISLEAGFGSFIIAQTLMGFAYIFLAFSLAEVISTTSFSGGAYGMARVVMGFYVGFIVASFELMEYITYVSFSAMYIATFFCDKFQWDTIYVPVIALIFYILLILVLLDQNYIFWGLNALFALSTLAILLVYCLGSLTAVNFQEYAPLKYTPTDDYYYGAGIPPMMNSTANGTTTDDMSYFNSHSTQAWFSGGMIAFLQILPYATWPFAGVESAALVTDMIDNPRINLSYGIVWSVLTLFVMTILVVFVAVSLPPGINELFPAAYFMNYGWATMGVSQNTAEWLVIPSQIAMGFGFAIPSFKLTHAIACSNLLPQKLGIQSDDRNLRAMIFAMTISYLIGLLSYYIPDINLTAISTIFACFTYLSDLFAYYKMKTDFSSRDHKFTNPFGISGAIFAACIFVLTIIALIFYQDNYNTAIAVAVYFGFLTMYYYAYAKKYQQFSDDEQKTLLVLHVMGTNKRKRKVAPRKWVIQKITGGKYSIGASNNKDGMSSDNNSRDFAPSSFANDGSSFGRSVDERLGGRRNSVVGSNRRSVNVTSSVQMRNGAGSTNSKINSPENSVRFLPYQNSQPVEHDNIQLTNQEANHHEIIHASQIIQQPAHVHLPPTSIHEDINEFIE